MSSSEGERLFHSESHGVPFSKVLVTLRTQIESQIKLYKLTV